VMTMDNRLTRSVMVGVGGHGLRTDQTLTAARDLLANVRRSFTVGHLAPGPKSVTAVCGLTASDERTCRLAGYSRRENNALLSAEEGVPGL
jgi:hypothetical protein